MQMGWCARSAILLAMIEKRQWSLFLGGILSGLYLILRAATLRPGNINVDQLMVSTRPEGNPMTVQPTTVRRPILVALTTVLALSLSGPALSPAYASAAEESAPPAEKITLDVVTVNGSGCPAGTAAVSVLPDNTGFRITYRDFIAQAGGEARPTDFRKNCQVNLLVHIPQGFTFAVARADYVGRARLEAGATGLQRTNYYFQGSSANNYVDHSFDGPFRALWHTIDATPVNELVYAPCGEVRSLNINTELRVNEGTANPAKISSLSLRSSEGNVETIVQFQWKTC
jgi:hypothetical protein